MLFLYTFFLYVLYALAHIAGFWSPKIKHWLDQQKNILGQIPPKKEKKRLWVHCASLGEFEQVRPILEKYQNHEIVVSFFSASGYEKRKNDPLIDIISYFPLDVPAKMKGFIEKINPDQVIFVKYEFWFNCLEILHQKKIPVFLVAAIFHIKQIFFMPIIGAYFIKYLNYFQFILLQNEKSLELAQTLKLKNAAVFGDPRCDRVFQTLQNPKDFPILVHFTQEKPTLILGSSWEPEEDLMIAYLINNNHYRLIIAPHDVGKKHVQVLMQKLGNMNYRLYSTCNAQTDFNQTTVLIIDTIGILSQIYAHATVAFIGGAFGKGLHNILEAAVFGLPILCGPKIEKYQEAIDLLESGGAFVVKNNQDLDRILAQLESIEDRKKAGAAAKQYILNNLGASERIYFKLNP